MEISVNQSRSKVNSHFIKTVPSLFCIAHCLSSPPLLAQIRPDTSLPVNSEVTFDGTVFTLEGGTQRGSNLFHSFEEFSVPTATEAFFTPPSTIENIITRVTGNNQSLIDGLLRANGTANLFFVNPNGIQFGPNASLNLGGSLIISTGDSLIFAEGIEFRANNTQTPPLLTLNVPIGLQSGENPGTITILGSGNNLFFGDNFATIRSDRPPGLQVNADQTLAFIGGEINLIGGNVTTLGGRLELGSVAGNQTVNLVPVAQGWTFDYSHSQDFQNINLSQAASLDASGLGGGNIQLQGHSIFLDQGSVILANTLGNEPGQEMILRATDTILLQDPNPLGYPSSLLTEVNAEATGNGGSLSIETQTLSLQNGAVISSGTFGGGDGGNLSINASEFIELKGLQDDFLPSFLLSEANETSTGNAGQIILQTGRLVLQDGALVSAATSSTGRGGDILIEVTDSVEIFGEAPAIQLNSGIITTGREGASGSSGNLTITTSFLHAYDGGGVNINHRGTGNAGTLVINGSNLLLENQGTLNASTILGLGGDVTLNIETVLQLRQNSQITVEALGGTEDGGNLTIESALVVALENSDIVANAVGGNGGNIQITTQGIFLSFDSEITASSQFGVSGAIIINTPDVDTRSGLIQLPEKVTDPSVQIIVGCGAAAGSSFTVTGKGGVPTSPITLIRGQTVWQDWQDFSFNNPLSVSGNRLIPQKPKAEIVEATGWIVNEEGQVELIASPPSSSPSVSLQCS